jgi:hypothetical protein
MKLVLPSLRFEESAVTRQQRNEEWFDGENVELRFVALLECTNGVCQEFLAVNGVGGYVQIAGDDEHGPAWGEWFRPTFVIPPFHFVRLPPNCPDSVREALAQSFSMLWASPATAATFVRIAIERLLDELRIPRAKRITGVRMQRITLHHRIGKLQERMAELGEGLLAIKWVGNAAAHVGELRPDDVFDAYDIIEHVTNELFSGDRKATRKLIREINTRKGPRASRVGARKR